MGNVCESPNEKVHYLHKDSNLKSDTLESSQQNFPDMPLWNNGKTTGLGIKEMPAYKCDLKINELEKKRKLFWNSHKKHKDKWNIIHQACIYPHIKSEEYLACHNFRTLDGCINMCVNLEDNSIFRVPNYCINDPYFELELLPKEGGNSSNVINVVLYDVTGKQKLNLNVNENTKGEEIINYYSNHNKRDSTKNKIRLLFGGGIIKNDETIYQHKVKNGDMIQVSVFKNI